jgi:hypothetical protein
MHGSRAKSLLGAAEATLYRKAHTYKEIDRVICCSAFMQSQIEKHPDLAGRTRVLHNFCTVPPLSLQLLVENVIKHNVISMKKPMTVKMWTEPQGDDVWICVANAVRPKQGGVTSGKGLENLSQRYRLLCGKEIVIEQNEKEFIVKLPLLYDQD